MIHGTRSSYNNKGCRCEPCRAANAEYHRTYVATHPDYREWKRRDKREAARRRRSQSA